MLWNRFFKASNYTGSVNCGIDILPGTLQDTSGIISNGGQNISCHGLSGQGGQRTKRMRTSFKHHQLRAMKNYFAYNQNPDAKDLKNLALKTGLTKRVLQVWFQNARAKWRRTNNKQESGLGVDGQPSSVKPLRAGSITNPESPSTGIGSPGGSSTRPFSTPSPSMTAMMHEQSELVAGSGTGPTSNGSSLDQFPQLSSSSCNVLLRRSTSPSQPSSITQQQPPTQSPHPHHIAHHHPHSHHPHSHHPSSSLHHQGNGDSIVSALTSFREIF
ncbi:LIM/homeobox protein Lhx9-like protein [Dinothrombium tinctorium]|uniref:LIM/homeobox protein Lhx9-like protein n=1 Tax=Dinothrombium tinctorium TaxID=1965070 RepID=A0A443RKJ5_9ACAR|nr:LIM/homeobox protein Lhx9-like protein [Dinothrombium tinctorium]